MSVMMALVFFAFREREGGIDYLHRHASSLLAASRFLLNFCSVQILVIGIWHLVLNFSWKKGFLEAKYESGLLLD